MLLLSSVSLLSVGFFDGSEVPVEPIVLWQEVGARGVRGVDQGVIHVLVVLADPVPQPCLLDVFPVSHLVLNSKNQKVIH